MLRRRRRAALPTAGIRSLDEDLGSRRSRRLQSRSRRRAVATPRAQVFPSATHSAARDRPGRGTDPSSRRISPVESARCAAAWAAARFHLLSQRPDLFRSADSTASDPATGGAAGAARIPVHLALRELERPETRSDVGRASGVSPRGTMTRTAEGRIAPASPRRLTIGIGEFAVSSRPGDVIVTHALGSCIAVCVFDAVASVAGMLHFLLPAANINPERARQQPAAFADTGIPLLFQTAHEYGLTKRRSVVT